MKYFFATGVVVATAFVVVPSIAGCGRAERPGEYPFASIEETMAQFDASDSKNQERWKFWMTCGATTGPFKSIGDHELNAGAGKSVSYSHKGARIVQDLETEEAVLIRRFVNRQGDQFLIIYTRRAGSDRGREI